MKVIGLCGAAGAGKDTAASLIDGYRTIAFADVLYQEVAQAFGVTVEWLKRREFKEMPSEILAINKCQAFGFWPWAVNNLSAPLYESSPRQILQWWGDYRRAQDADYFVKAVHLEVCAGMRKAVITDVRFANEAALIRQLGGEIWQIVRPGVVAGSTGHKSDTDGSEFAPDRVIVNDGSLEDLLE